LNICLDTSAYSHMHRGHPPAVHLIAAADRIFVPVIVLGELRAGFLGGSKRPMNEALLHVFLQDPTERIGTIDADTASAYAKLDHQLHQAGTPIPKNDLWIAAVAVRVGATIVTYDAHFRRLRGVEVRLLAA